MPIWSVPTIDRLRVSRSLCVAEGIKVNKIEDERTEVEDRWNDAQMKGEEDGLSSLSHNSHMRLKG